MATILITGARGFSASRLIPLLSQDGRDRLVFTDLHCAPAADPCIPCDLTDLERTHVLLSDVRPDQIYHLAGSFSNAFDTDFRSNVLSSRNLLEALLDLGNKGCRVLLIGSAAEYGNPPGQGDPIAESSPLRPATVYGLTKAMQSQLMRYYVDAHGMDLVMARPFNLMGRGISSKLFIGTVYEQIDRFKKGEIDRIVVGSLASKRDYISVEEAVDAYRTVMSFGASGEVYNVGTGEPVEISRVLREILEKESVSPDVIEERAYSSSTVTVSFADIRKLKSLQRLRGNRFPTIPGGA